MMIEGFTLFDLFGSAGPVLPGEHYDDSVMTPEWRTASVYFPLPGPASECKCNSDCSLENSLPMSPVLFYR